MFNCRFGYQQLAASARSGLSAASRRHQHGVDVVGSGAGSAAGRAASPLAGQVVHDDDDILIIIFPIIVIIIINIFSVIIIIIIFSVIILMIFISIIIIMIVVIVVIECRGWVLPGSSSQRLQARAPTLRCRLCSGPLFRTCW